MYSLHVELSIHPSHILWSDLCDTLYQFHCVGIFEGEIPPPSGENSLVAFDEFEYALNPGILDTPMIFDAYFDKNRDAENACRAITPHIKEILLSYAITEVQEKNYAELWKENFKPIRANPNWLIRATWHDRSVSKEITELIIEPGMAFGTGSHETTRSCLELISYSASYTSQKSQAHVLDFGCGSGILAIALKKIGFGKVDAVDIDPLSVEASNNNAKLNSVEINTSQSLLKLYPHDKTSFLDGIVANILKNTLIDFAPTFKKLIKPGGFLILSGLLDTQNSEILDIYNKLGFTEIRRIIRNDSSPKDLIEPNEMRWVSFFLRNSA